MQKAYMTADPQLCRRFTLADIQSATAYFRDADVIGKGGFGKVYKALIDNGSVNVAMKRLSSNSNQGEREFATEMETLTKFRHHNLVSLIGYCNEDGEMILVYDYMVNGTLADHLYELSLNGSSLSRNQRLKICIGAGRGLDYLHSGCSIIHRDVKSTNILLGDKFTAKVSDCGLAKRIIADDLESHVSTNVKGTFGYIDPSYFTSGRLTKASDTYAFGVVLLEVLSGKPAIGGNVAEDELCMSMWALEKIRNGKADQILSPSLRGEISESCLKTFVRVAKRCLHYEPKKRVTMTQAVAQLELALEQQERKGRATYKLQLWPFWNRIIPTVPLANGNTGSTRKDHNEVAVEEDDVLEYKQSADMLLNIEIVPSFPLAEVKDVTHGFDSKCLIANGREGRSAVFQGVLKTGQHAAIKRLYKQLPDQEFLALVSTIYRLKHENVVELLGYCDDGGLHILVYEFAPRRSLHDILHGPQKLALSLAQKIGVALGAAKGLNCIHEAYCNELPAHAFSTCYRYHPPEFQWDGHSQKGDVYSFGIILYELFRPEISIAVMGVYSPCEAVAKVISIANNCLHSIADRRPSMITVLNDLEIASHSQVYLE